MDESAYRYVSTIRFGIRIIVMKRTIRVNAILNTIKQLMSIVFPIITIPYATRTLLPENFGKVNTGNSIISYISLLAGLGISTYAVREGALVRSDRKKLNSFSNQVFSINLISTVFAYAVLAMLILLVPHYYEYRYLLLIQGISVIFETLGADWINTIEEDFLYITVRYILMHLISIGLLFTFVKEPSDYLIYAAICLVTSAGAKFLNIFYIRRYVHLRFTFHIDWKKHLPSILILFGNAIAITVYVSSDITMLELFKGAQEVGVYSVSSKIYSVGKQILNAILVVSIPRLSMLIGAASKEAFCELGNKIFSALITLMLPFIAGLIVFREEAVFFVGGESYMSGTSSLLILSIAVAASLSATFYSACILMPLREEKSIFIGTTISAVINVVLNFAFIPLWGSNGAAITTLISECFVAVFYWYRVHKTQLIAADSRTVVTSLIGSIAVALLSLLMKRLFHSFPVYFSLSFFGAFLFYCLIQLIGKNPLVIDILHQNSR